MDNFLIEVHVNEAAGGMGMQPIRWRRGAILSRQEPNQICDHMASPVNDAH